jgi:hypothetical protein
MRCFEDLLDFFDVWRTQTFVFGENIHCYRESFGYFVLFCMVDEEFSALVCLLEDGFFFDWCAFLLKIVLGLEIVEQFVEDDAASFYFGRKDAVFFDELDEYFESVEAFEAARRLVDPVMRSLAYFLFDEVDEDEDEFNAEVAGGEAALGEG